MASRKKENDEGTKFQTGKVVLVSFCHFIHDIYSSFLAPLLPFIIEKFALSLTQAGLLSTVMQLPALLNPFIGKLADRISFRYFIILAPMFTAIPMSLLGLAPNYAVVMILLFVTGISVSLFHVPAPVMVYRVSGMKSGRGMSFYMTGGELARTVGPLAITAAVSFLGFDGYYPVMIVGIAASLVMYLKLRDVPATPKKQETPSIRATIRQMKPLLLPLSGIVVVRGFMHGALSTFLPLYILSRTDDIWLAGISLSVLEAAGVVGVLTIGSLSDHFGRKRMLLFSLVLAPIALLLFVFSSGWWQFPVLVLTGFTLLSTTPVMLAMIQEYSEDGSSSANGVFMMISFLARSAVVVLIGFVADQVGLEKTYVFCALIGFLGIPFVLALPEDRR
ncbi:MAG: MFS transporter [Deltaproteobacteria bacterium]|nr:MFS transporter [Deltaproteobacteria bacterium]